MRILPDPRERLVELDAARGQSLAELSRMLRRRDGYLRCYVTEGYPEQLIDADRGLLCRHFDVPETVLGGDDPRWAKRSARLRAPPVLLGNHCRSEMAQHSTGGQTRALTLI